MANNNEGIANLNYFLEEAKKITIKGEIRKPRNYVVKVYFDEENEFREFQKAVGIKGYEVEGETLLKIIKQKEVDKK